PHPRLPGAGGCARHRLRLPRPPGPRRRRGGQPGRRPPGGHGGSRHRLRGSLTMTAATASRLDVHELTVEFALGRERARAFPELSFTVELGSLLLLLGPSGCGKTTLLSCLAGLRRPTSGTIHFGGVA